MGGKLKNIKGIGPKKENLALVLCINAGRIRSFVLSLLLSSVTFPQKTSFLRKANKGDGGR